MKSAALLGLIPLLLQPVSAHAAADDLRVLAPASDWTLDFADERCSLIREFGEGHERVRLQIDSFGPRPGYRVTLSGSMVPGSDAALLTELRMAYSPDTSARERVTMLTGKIGEDDAVSFRQGFLPNSPRANDGSPVLRQASSPQAEGFPPSPPPPNPEPSASWQLPAAPQPGARLASEFERSVTHVTFEFALQRPLRLATGNMAAAFEAMRGCVDDLVASWGVDATQNRTLSRAAQLVDVSDGWRRLRPAADTHPGYTERRIRSVATAMLSSGQLVPVRLMIDTTGKPTACVVQLASIGEAHRAALCDPLNSYSYEPALDGGGRPVSSFILFESR